MLTISSSTKLSVAFLFVSGTGSSGCAETLSRWWAAEKDGRCRGSQWDYFLVVNRSDRVWGWKFFENKSRRKKNCEFIRLPPKEIKVSIYCVVPSGVWLDYKWNHHRLLVEKKVTVASKSIKMQITKRFCAVTLIECLAVVFWVFLACHTSLAADVSTDGIGGGRALDRGAALDSSSAEIISGRPKISYGTYLHSRNI